MGIMSEVIAPIFQLIAYIVLGGWFLFLIYWILKKIFKNLSFTIKYKVFRKKWPEGRVKWCMNAYDLGWDELKIKKFLLLNNKPDKKPYTKKEIKEILYIFSQVKKNNEKGGVKNGRNRKSDEQIKAIKEG